MHFEKRASRGLKAGTSRSFECRVSTSRAPTSARSSGSTAPPDTIEKIAAVLDVSAVGPSAD